MTKSSEVPTKSNELIIYQLGELKNLVTNLDGKVDKNAENVEKRLQTLELWKAAQDEALKNTPKLDVQRLIFTLLGLIGALVTGIFTAKQTGVLK